MRDGWIRVGAASPGLRVGDVDFNAWSIVGLAREAAVKGVRMLVLPELCLTGCSCGDMFWHKGLQEAAARGLELVCRETEKLDQLLVLGVPIAHGGELYNCAAAVQGGKVLGLVPKTNVCAGGGFWDGRYFSPPPAYCRYVTIGAAQVPLWDKQLFCCETLPELVVCCEVGQDAEMLVTPSTHHVQAGATVVAHLTAYGEVLGIGERRRQDVRSLSRRLLCGYVSAGTGEGESTTDMVFSAHHLVGEGGEVLRESRPFAQETIWTELDLQDLQSRRMRLGGRCRQDEEEHLRQTFVLPVEETPLSRYYIQNPFLPRCQTKQEEALSTILDIQAAGLKKRIAHTKARCAVLGVSGGLDSTLALLVTVRAMQWLGRDASEVLAITMPGYGTTSRTKNNAVALAERLGCTVREIPIHKAMEQHFADIGQEAGRFDAAFENAQARERTQILMDIANKESGLMVGSGDLSELALGWATYNGDHMSMYGVNSSMPKTVIRALVTYLAHKEKNAAISQVLLDVVDTPVSPELLPGGAEGQVTEELIGPYELHDFFLYHYVGRGLTKEKVLRIAGAAFVREYSKGTIEKWLDVFCRRFFGQQYKRSALPDGAQVSEMSLSPRGGWRMPSDGSFAP